MMSDTSMSYPPIDPDKSLREMSTNPQRYLARLRREIKQDSMQEQKILKKIGYVDRDQ